MAISSSLRWLALLAAGALILGAQPHAPSRPPIVGLAHVALRTDDLAAAKKFYGTVLGYPEVFQSEPSAGAPARTYFKVNDRQYIELLAELSGPEQDRLVDVGFETADARKLRDYLASKSVAVPADGES